MTASPEVLQIVSRCNVINLLIDTFGCTSPELRKMRIDGVSEKHIGVVIALNGGLYPPESHGLLCKALERYQMGLSLLDTAPEELLDTLDVIDLLSNTASNLRTDKPMENDK